MGWSTGVRRSTRVPWRAFSWWRRLGVSRRWRWSAEGSMLFCPVNPKHMMLSILSETYAGDLLNNIHDIRGIWKAFPRVIFCFNQFFPQKVGDVERASILSKSHQQDLGKCMNRSGISFLWSEGG